MRQVDKIEKIANFYANDLADENTVIDSLRLYKKTEH